MFHDLHVRPAAAAGTPATARGLLVGGPPRTPRVQPRHWHSNGRSRAWPGGSPQPPLQRPPNQAGRWRRCWRSWAPARRRQRMETGRAATWRRGLSSRRQRRRRRRRQCRCRRRRRAAPRRRRPGSARPARYSADQTAYSRNVGYCSASSDGHLLSAARHSSFASPALLVGSQC